MNGGESARRLAAVRDQARRMVPFSAPVVAVASARTLHRATAAEGEVLPLVLASPAFTQPQSGSGPGGSHPPGPLSSSDPCPPPRLRSSGAAA